MRAYSIPELNDIWIYLAFLIKNAKCLEMCEIKVIVWFSWYRYICKSIGNTDLCY